MTEAPVHHLSSLVWLFFLSSRLASGVPSGLLILSALSLVTATFVERGSSYTSEWRAQILLVRKLRYVCDATA